ncbi:MAG: hypothetical protein KDH48_27630 [Rhodoferax sp.]|nr:hypothetical protein [Rhodoferax sp.]
MMQDTADYRVESTGTILFRLMPGPGRQRHQFHDRAIAVAMAVKGVTDPPGAEIRVVHVPTGQVIFRVPAKAAATEDEA